ncbi:MAG: hypothetical protein QXE79_04740 [Candidatus Bathyarchaeia archaeon]
MPHKHSKKSNWAEKKASRKRLLRILRTAYYDREKAELIALKGSKRLDVMEGEVLKSPRYVRVFRET